MRLKWITLLYALAAGPLVLVLWMVRFPEFEYPEPSVRDGWLLVGFSTLLAAVLPWWYPRYPVHFFGLILTTAIASLIVGAMYLAIRPHTGLVLFLLLPLINVYAWPFLLPAWGVAGISLWLATRAGFHVADGPPRHVCPACGYPTRGLREPICPECGRDLFPFIGGPE